MKAHVLLSPLNADELFFSEKTTVVIDVLRATSSVVTALQNGAREVIPVETMEFAMKISGGQNILAGERNSAKIEGFDFGNSPLEFTREATAGKSVIFYTTNGSKALVRAKFSQNLFVASYLNISAVADKLIELNEDFVILCAGDNGMFSLEDTLCAGKLIEFIDSKTSGLELTDAAKASLKLNTVCGKDILATLKETEHGRELLEAGFEKDLEFISQIDFTDIVPFLESGAIKIKLKEEDKAD